jgi:pimeloyl-ACP methyl ester carboxylesterase
MLEQTALINGLVVNYKIGGEGKPLLILHGWGGSSESWVNVQRILGRYGYRVICPDFPGFGKSERPKIPWNVSDYENWAIEFLKFLNLEKFYLVGHSFGGRVAIKLAVDYPEKIKKLILCAPAGIKSEPNLETKILLSFAKIGNSVFTFRHLRRFKRGVRNFFYIFLRNRDYAKANGIMKETMKKVLEEDLSLYVPRIEKKTLIIWGKNDRVVPVKFAHIFEGKIKGSELSIIPKVGHGPHLFFPEKTAKIIAEFLEK